MSVLRRTPTALLYVPACLATLALAHSAIGGDWPTYGHDAARSNVAEEALPVPLYEAWVYHTMHAPRPAWPEPARQDFWHELPRLRPLVTYDRAFHPVIVGNRVYFGSSAEDYVRCLDGNTGDVLWTFFTEGPVRLAPTIADGKVYVGSDDGWIYCLSGGDGALLWKHRPPASDHRIPGNGRIVSLLPVRTDVLVEGGMAYYCAGIFPAQGVYRCAVSAQDGSEVWLHKTQETSPQGYLMASAQRLYVPTGRTTPVVFDRASGRLLGQLEGQGGAYALLVGDAVISGPGRTTGQLDLSDVNTKESLVTFDGLRMIIQNGVAYIQSDTRLSAINYVKYMPLARQRHELEKQRDEAKRRLKELRDKPADPESAQLHQRLEPLELAINRLTDTMQACTLWKQYYAAPYALVLSGSHLFVGGEDKVAAISAADGAEVWTAEVTGKAHALAVANGGLFVGTDRGAIHCFTPQRRERERVVAPPPDSDPPYPTDEWTRMYDDTARFIVDTVWPASNPCLKKGYALVLGCREGRLAYELAKRTELQIVGIEEDPQKVAAARRTLQQAGLYGARVTVHQGPPDRLPYTSYFANLVVSDEALVSGELPPSAAEAYRVLRPYGGTLVIGRPKKASGRMAKLRRSPLEHWLKETGAPSWNIRDSQGLWGIIRRGAVPGAGEWRQLYADSGHTACSNDALLGPVALQWFGDPGPRDIIDRHHRPMASLVKDGRVFVPANDRVLVLDAYNGAPLWDLSVPNSRRVGALKNCGHILVAEDYAYVAVGQECWAADVRSGKRAATFKVPEVSEGRCDWGYLNQFEDLLLGTGQRAGASFTRLHRETVDLIEGDFRPVVVSDYLFAVDRGQPGKAAPRSAGDGAALWTYRGGTIMNNAIAVGGSRVYFVESRNPEVDSDGDGRVRIDAFCAKDTFLVAVDVRTGDKVFERPVAFPFQHIMFLSVARGIVLVTGSYNHDGRVSPPRIVEEASSLFPETRQACRVYYGLFAFRGDTGERKWENSFLGLNVRGTEPAETEGTHGEQWQHPVIIRDTVYLRPYAFNLHTGEKLEYIVYRGGHGCGGLTGSAHYLYGRGSNPRMYPLNVPATEGISLTQTTRPGCWLNIIPAGGLILIPESSSGCTCAYPIQTSLAFIPRELSGLPPE